MFTNRELDFIKDYFEDYKHNAEAFLKKLKKGLK